MEFGGSRTSRGRRVVSRAWLVGPRSSCSRRSAQRAGAEQEQGDSRVVGPRYGISVSVPDGWEASLTRGAFVAETENAQLQLFETGRENASPPTDLDEYPELTGDLRLDARDFAGGARRTFQRSGRLFVLFVETGSRPPVPRTLTEVNEILGSLEVAAGDFYDGVVEPARFAARPGWHIGASAPDDVDADGEFTTTWAATIPWADEWNALPPFRTLERLPREGIAIWLGLTRTSRFPPEFARREPPFELGTFERYESWEGQVRDIPEYRLWATVDEATTVDLRVLFGRRDPTPAMRAEAQAMLDEVEIPDWGPWELEP